MFKNRPTTTIEQQDMGEPLTRTQLRAAARKDAKAARRAQRTAHDARAKKFHFRMPAKRG